MLVGTTEAASLLNISAQRVRVLLKEGRIQGARKINGRTWGIPLYKGRPRISGRKRGPKPNWSPQRHCGKNTIHFNRPNIERNRKLKKVDPQAKDEYVLIAIEQKLRTLSLFRIGSYNRDRCLNLCFDCYTAQRGSEILGRGHEIEIHGPCRIVYRPDLPHSCGATVWIE
ncbi:MAG: helix-turn-helix domain-containing protein, partial [Trichodesmium sp. MAG_R02]|nr:helix-turn-helix domain-containing protein [Trichodesmium sp. MAG_R02]